MSQIYFIPTQSELGDILTLTGNSGGPVGPDGSGNINVVGDGTTASVVGNPGTNTLTITVTTMGFAWQSVTSVSPANPITIAPENGYICDGGAQVTFILPIAPTLGQTFIIVSNTAPFRINQNAAQQLCVGTAATTAGAGGFLTSNGTGDTVEFVYVGGNIFRGTAPQGTMTLT